MLNRKINLSGEPAKRFLESLDEIFQTEPEYIYHDSLDPNIPGVTSIIYTDIPEKGMTTAITYGLSLLQHVNWQIGKRSELIISVESDDLAWGEVIGFLANKLRGKCAFTYGNTINFRDKISNFSEMDAFLIFAPSILEKSDYLDIDIGQDYKINLAGIYPIYSEEIKLIEKWGPEKFWRHKGFNNYSILRKPIVEKV